MRRIYDDHSAAYIYWDASKNGSMWYQTLGYLKQTNCWFLRFRAKTL